MYTINNKKNCTIYNGTLFQDLVDYSFIYNDLDSNDDKVYIRWSGEPPASSIANGQSVGISSSFGAIMSANINDSVATGIWLPLFLNQSSSNTGYSRVFDKQNVDNTKVLGLPSFLTFGAYFKNWLVYSNYTSQTPGSMITDWNITSSVPSFEAQYGLLCWYRVDGPNPLLKLNEIPNGSIVTPYTAISGPNGSVLSPNIPVVKLNNSKLKRSDKKSNVVGSTSTSFWQDAEIFDLDQSNFNIDNNLFQYYEDSRRLKQGNRTFSMWVSDGEAFSYFDSPTDRLRNRARSLCSKTYLSPIMMPIYREVKNKLLMKWSRSTTTGLPRNQARLLQKLAYYLSTFPLIDRVTIDIDFSYNLTDYLSKAIADNASEISALTTVLFAISNRYSSQFLTDKIRSKSYIETNKDLIQKLLSKYGASLMIDGGIQSLSYKHLLKNGAHALIGIDSCMKINQQSSNSIYLNNCSISLGNLNYISDISGTGSLIHLSGTNSGSSLKVPLVDIAVKRDSPGIFSLGSDREVPFNAPETRVRDLNIYGDTYQTTYFWEQISGPDCLRFSDYNKDTFRQSRFITSTDYNPDVYIRETGIYEIKCTKITNGYVDSDSLVITTSSNSSLVNPDISTISVQAPPKIINSIPKKIGFHKHGMVWIADTENYVTDDYTYKPTSDFGILNTHRLKDVRIDLSRSTALSIVSNDANLSITFIPGSNTQTIVNAINIENARYDSSDYCQCASLYDEKIYRDPVNPMAPVLGTSNFARDVEQQYQFVYYNNNGAILPKLTSSVGAPNTISTKLSPPIVAYGGYESKKVDTIGIRMPGHPTANELPRLIKRNDIVTPDPTGVHCFLKEVEGGSTLSFSKGFFDPSVGWVSSSNNTSCVISDDPIKQKTYVLKGAGFFDLRSSSSSNINTYRSKIILNQDYSLNNYTQHNSVYGYRTYNEDQRFDHNFRVDVDRKYWYNSDYCGQNSITYNLPTGILGTKTIQDLEVKLNFLNYPDPQNLVVWLEVYNSNISELTAPLPQLYSKGEAGYTQINTDIKNMNVQSAAYSKIYLLNQEHISNYDTNFSITFSDNAAKQKTANRNTSEFNGFHKYTDTVKNNDRIQPTIVPTGYSDSINLAAIKTNQINNSLNYFAKLKNVTLTSDTVFVLNIGVVNSFEYNTKILDDLVINSTRADSDSLIGSSNIGNSLCSWDIIIHTDDSFKYSNSDILGKINYADYFNNYSNARVSGYNFIFNFSGIEYLVPQSNLNAPYHYMNNINSCFFDQDGVGDSWSFIRPSYNENMRTLNLGIMQYMLAGANAMGGAAFGAVGGLMGLYALQSVYEQGGRSDPLINYFIETSLLDQTEAQDAQYYKPVYSKKFFGIPDRALLAISTDGNYWYNVDVPIFKLSNSPILEKNKYKYIKLNGNNIPGISSFAYKVIANYKDLDLAPVVKNYDTNIVASGLISNENSKGSIVLLEGQNTASENGYYMVSEGIWSRLPSLDRYFLRYNNISAYFTEASLSLRKNIILDGQRPYNFFDSGETITLSNSLGISNVIITDKSYIMTSNGTKTILTLSSAIAQDGVAYKDSSNANVLLLYKSNYNNLNIDIDNTWMLEKTKNDKSEQTDPLYRGSAYGEGSIGYGTDLLDSNILRKLTFDHSEILETNKLLNNHENDLYKFNSVTVEGNNTVQEITFSSLDGQSDLLKGYSYTADDYFSKPLLNRDKNSEIEHDLIKNSIIKNEFANHYFMEIKSNKFKGSSFPDSGKLHIENDHKRIFPVYFSSGDITKMQNRVAYLSESGIPIQYAAYQTSTDPSECYTSYNELTCPKTKAYQTFRILEKEKNHLLDALSLPRSSAGIHGITGNVEHDGTFDASSSSLKVSYDVDNYSYWINIDPEQVCSLNDELSARVLESISMKAIPISSIESEGIVPGEDSHIAPATSFSGIPSGIDMSLLMEGLTYKYVVSPSTLQANKDLWPNVNWNNTEEFTYGTTSTVGDSKKIMINKLNSYKDMMICIQENYIRPSGMSSVGKRKVKDIINLDSSNSVLVRFRNIPRKIKGIDSENFEKYVYDRNGNLVKSSRPPSSVGKVANNFTCWHCIDSSGQYLQKLPQYYEVANEMRYRAFYGSADGVENRNTLYSDSKNDWEWIPYEYYDESPAVLPASNPNPTQSYGTIISVLDARKSQDSQSVSRNHFSVMALPTDFNLTDYGGVGKKRFFIFEIAGVDNSNEKEPKTIKGMKLGVISGKDQDDALYRWIIIWRYNAKNWNPYNVILEPAPDSYKPINYVEKQCYESYIEDCYGVKSPQCVEETRELTPDRLWQIRFLFFFLTRFDCYSSNPGSWYSEPGIQIEVDDNGNYIALEKFCSFDMVSGQPNCSWKYIEGFGVGKMPIADMYRSAYFELSNMLKQISLLEQRLKKLEKELESLTQKQGETFEEFSARFAAFQNMVLDVQFELLYQKETVNTVAQASERKFLDSLLNSLKGILNATSLPTDIQSYINSKYILTGGLSEMTFNTTKDLASTKQFYRKCKYFTDENDPLAGELQSIKNCGGSGN